MLPVDIDGSVKRLLASGPWSGQQTKYHAIETLRGDGSNRRFWRLALTGRSVMVIAPEHQEGICLREAGAGFRIGQHLGRKGVPVPQIYGFDEQNGVLLCEDLGDTQLHLVAVATDYGNPESLARLRDLYREALAVLVHMQVRGAEDFEPAWCWDTPRYDRSLMLEKESGYFLRAFWLGLLGQTDECGLKEEFKVLAEAAGEAPAEFFLHRDFQSRNLMVSASRIRVIDYQGGRLGPLGYDLAALLLDPYARLPEWFQEELYGYYLARLAELHPVDERQFRRWYLPLALQRNLQILGAFAFLSTVRGKPFFRDFIRPALASLVRLCGECREPEMPRLTAVAERSRKLLR